MKISKLIKLLQEVQETHGDVEVLRARDEEWNDVHGIEDVSLLYYVAKVEGLYSCNPIREDDLEEYDLQKKDCHKVIVLT